MTTKLKLSVGTKISYIPAMDNFDICTILAIKFNRIYFSDGGETTLEFMNKALKDPQCYNKINETEASQISEFIL